MGSSFDQIAPITKTVEDIEVIFDVMKGKDGRDMTSFDSDFNKDELKGNYKIAIPKGLIDGISDNTKKTFNDFTEKIKENGNEIEEIEIPILKDVLAIYYILIPAEVSSNLARYDGLRYGTKVEGKDL
jgi:aspartyl-tRNA(Asn)/glutamyl-tRNA(Gln) amidotransferase subunit A